MEQQLPHLVVVSLAVRQALPLVVPVAQERLLTLGAHKVLSTQEHRHKSLDSAYCGEEMKSRTPGEFSSGGNERTSAPFSRTTLVF